MLGTIMRMFIAVVVLMGAGALSFTYLEDRFGPSVPNALTPSQVATGTVPVFPPKVSEVLPGNSTTKAPAELTSKVPNKGALPKTNSPTRTVAPREVVAPGPLRAEVKPTTSSVASLPSVVLTAQGVFEYTNRARLENGGLPSLTQNTTLDRVAMAKLVDMFTKQYFEHVSPLGVGPSDLAKAEGYAYVVVGENLALGNFATDSKLVDAWMASPGHRANILNSRYREIGIAVGRGMYEGRQTWLAVQSFGLPLSACPTIDAQKKLQIETNNVTIANMKASLDAKKSQIDATPPQDPNYNVYVNEFNSMIGPYNALIEANRILVEEYNKEVKAFNTCVAGTPSN